MTTKSSTDTPVFETEHFSIIVGKPPVKGDEHTPLMVYNIYNRTTGVVEEFSTVIAHAIEWATHMTEKVDALMALPEVEEVQRASH